MMKETSNNLPTWDAEQWLKDFAIAKAKKETHDVKIQVWKSTLEVVNKREYVTEEGKIITLPLNPNILQESKYYKEEIPALKADVHYDTVIKVENADCLEYAKALKEADATDDVCVLNLASPSNPGGGVTNGSSAQEEYLFRCSDYFRSLYQYAKKFDPEQYGIPLAKESYPLNANFGAIFSRGVTIFRASEKEGYALIEKPWRVNFIAAATKWYPFPYNTIPEKDIPTLLNKIRTILRVTYTNGQRRLVLGALGCGAFHNPPVHMSQMFYKVLNEPEFVGIFKEIHFAIVDDHNARHNKDSNYQAFKNRFAADIDEEGKRLMDVMNLYAEEYLKEHPEEKDEWKLNYRYNK